MATAKKFAGRISEPLFDQIQVERRIQGVTFESWLKSLMAREDAYRRMNRQLVHELARWRRSQPTMAAPRGIRPSEDPQYDDLLRRTQP